MTQNVLLVAYTIGLIGSVLLWRFGLPYKDINRDGHVSLVLEQEDEAEKQKWKIYNRISHVGIGLIALSFFLQIISLFLEAK